MLDKPLSISPLPDRAGEAPDIAVAVTIQSQVNGRRSIVMQTYIGRDEPPAAHHALADKLSAVMDRQEAKFDLEGVKLSLEADQKGLKQAVEAFLGIEKRNAEEWKRRHKKGEPELSATEHQAKIAHENNIKNFNAAIAKKKVEIVELEAKIAKVD